MKKFTLLLFLPLLIFGSCKKDVIPDIPESNAPVYFISGLLDGDSINIQAGRNGYALHLTNQEENQVMQWYAIIENNTNNFNIQLSDGQIDLPLTNLDLSAINQIEVSNSVTPDVLSINKSNFMNKEFIDKIEWKVNNQLMNSEDLVISNPGLYEIESEITFIDQSKAINSSQLLLGYQKNASGTLRFITGEDNSILAFMESSVDINQIEWFIDDSLITTSYNKSSIMLDEVPSNFNLKAKVYYQNEVCRNYSIFVNAVSPNFYIEDLTKFENQSSIYFDNKIRLAFNYEGIKYESLNGTFVINNISEISDETGQKIYKFEGLLNGEMYNTENQSIVNADLELHFALQID